MSSINSTELATQSPPSESQVPPVHQDPAVLPFRERRPAIFHFTILAAVILPITLSPYLLLRRRSRRLNQSLDELRAAHVALVQDLAQLRLETSANTDALARMRSMDRETKKKLDDMKILADQRDNAVNRTLHGARMDLRKLSETSRSQSATLGALGTSLADVAAFMYETNIQQGSSNEQSDKKVEDLRSLALMMVHEHRLPAQSNRKDFTKEEHV